MRTDLVFYEPHEQARKRPKFAPQLTASLHVNTTGAFVLNVMALEMLDIRLGHRVALGNSRTDPREWFLMRVQEGGYPLRNDSRRRLCFNAQPLRKLLLSTLPHAPTDKGITLKLDPLTILEESGAEIYPLLTAPYYLPPAPKPEKTEHPVHRRVLALTMPGLLGVLHQADLP